MQVKELENFSIELRSVCSRQIAQRVGDRIGRGTGQVAASGQFLSNGAPRVPSSSSWFAEDGVRIRHRRDGTISFADHDFRRCSGRRRGREKATRTMWEFNIAQEQAFEEVHAFQAVFGTEAILTALCPEDSSALKCIEAGQGTGRCPPASTQMPELVQHAMQGL